SRKRCRVRNAWRCCGTDPVRAPFSSFGNWSSPADKSASACKILACRTPLSLGMPSNPRCGRALYSEYADDGGLMAYGASVPAISGRGAVYVDRILRGAKPSDLPVEQPSIFELVINLRTAKALGLDLAPTLLARANRVIE